MKIAIVTGVLGGIGKESALQLCRAGYAVVGMDVIDATDLSAFDGLDFTYVKGDLASSASREELVQTALQKGEIRFRFIQTGRFVHRFRTAFAVAIFYIAFFFRTAYARQLQIATRQSERRT